MSTVVQQVGRLAFTLVLARIVGPADFGVVAQATIYVGFVQLFLDQGFGAALIQKKNLEKEDVASVFWLNVASAGVLVVVTLLLAPAIGDFFDTPETTSVLRVTSLVIILYALSVVPLSLMNRNLQFRKMAVIDIWSVAVGGVAGVVAALLGAGYWALVVQTITSALISLVGLLRMTGRPPLHGSLARLRSMASFGWGLVGARIVQYGGKNADNILVGRYLAATDLALYALSYRMLTLPLQTFGRVVNKVAFPLFSQMQGHPDRIRAWFLAGTTTTAVCTYPVLTLAILTEPVLIPTALGAAWVGAVVPMQVLTAVAYRSIVLKLIGPVFMSAGRTGLLLRFAMIEVSLAVVGFVIGLRWGITGVAVGYLVATYAVGPITVTSAGRMIGLRRGQYLGALFPTAMACVAMVVSWLAVTELADWQGAPVWGKTATGVIVAVATYLAWLRFLAPKSWAVARKLGIRVLRHRGNEKNRTSAEKVC